MTWAWKKPSQDFRRKDGSIKASSSSARPTCPLSTRTTCSCSGSLGPPVGDNVVKVPLHRRPWFESYSASMVDMKQRGSGPTDAATRRLTQATCPQTLRILRSFSASLWKRRPEGNSALRALPPSVEAHTSTDLRVELALQRLALAAGVGGVLSLSKHEDFRVALQSAKLEVPPSEHARV